MLVGWRLTQMPKSQALEFLLVSPLRPHWLLVNEALTGAGFLALVTLSGLPILAYLSSWALSVPGTSRLLLMPFSWGLLTGLSLATFAYEPLTVRRGAEAVTMLLILFYLIVGVLAGENLRQWLDVSRDLRSASCVASSASTSTTRLRSCASGWSSARPRPGTASSGWS